VYNIYLCVLVRQTRKFNMKKIHSRG